MKEVIVAVVVGACGAGGGGVETVHGEGPPDPHLLPRLHARSGPPLPARTGTPRRCLGPVRHAGWAEMEMNCLVERYKGSDITAGA